MSRMHNREVLRRIATAGVLTAAAFILSYLEAILPFSLGIPGVKLGLANLAVVLTMALLSRREAWVVALVRILLVGFTFGNPYSMLYALCGGVCSVAVMSLLWNSRRLSVLGISMAGALAHNIGQLLFAAAVTETARLWWYLPLLLISGAVTGGLIGAAALAVLRRFSKVKRTI